VELPSAAGRFRFHGFTLDTGERRLDAGGLEIHLRPKTLDTLIYLVERRGRLVSRRDLLDAIWADVEVTENVLSQCVRELREALGDDQKRPRFIQTVQRSGYRFIAELEEEPPGESSDYEEELTAVAMLATEDQGADAGSSSQAMPAWSPLLRNWRRALTALILIATSAVAFGYWLSHRRPVTVFSPRAWILITDFENLTGEPVFDAALRAQLERELSVSRSANFVPPGRVADTLKLMRQPADTRVTESVGREICLRDGSVQGMITGSIQRIGGAYSIALKLMEPATESTIAVFDAHAGADEEVLEAIRRLAADVRRQLGEPSTAIAESPARLERATTPSLEALTLYSRGLTLMDQFEWQRAETLFDEAVRQDPEFALGHLFRGISRMMTSRDCREDFRRAAALASSVTLRERLMIEAGEASVSGDQAKALELYEALLDQYPDDYWGHEFASWLYFQAERYPKWAEHQAACRRLRPNFAQPWFHAGWVHLIFDGDFEKAQTEFARVLELRPDFPSVSVQCSLAFVHWMRGHLDEAAAEFAEFRASRMDLLTAGTQVAARPYLARFYDFLGRPEEALTFLETNREMTLPQPDEQLARQFRFARALIYQGLGRERELVQLLTEVAAETTGMPRVEALGWMAISAARRGDKSEALRLQDLLLSEAREPEVDFWHPRLPLQLERAKRAFSLQIEGETLLSEKLPKAAIVRFDEVLETAPARSALFATMLSPRVWLAAAQSKARAHAQLGEWDKAASSWEAILQRKALCMGTDGAAAIWLDSLESIATSLEKANRPEDAIRYRDELSKVRMARR
jgi:DNA-binding winged helix-turn-helix (wHTH) protein/tetratricopeptide (TPR) repeat protein